MRMESLDESGLCSLVYVLVPGLKSETVIIINASLLRSQVISFYHGK